MARPTGTRHGAASGRSSTRSFWITDESPNVGPNDRPERDAGRNRSRNWPHSTTRAPTSVHAPASGADDATPVSRSDPVMAAMMNTVPPRRYSAEIAVGSPIRRRNQSACSSSVWNRTSRNRLAIEKITRIGQLVADGQRHVGEQQQPDDDHGVDRPAMAERGVARELRRPPRHETQHEQVMPGVLGEEQPGQGEIGPGADDLVGRLLEEDRRCARRWGSSPSRRAAGRAARRRPLRRGGSSSGPIPRAGR